MTMPCFPYNKHRASIKEPLAAIANELTVRGVPQIACDDGIIYMADPLRVAAITRYYIYIHIYIYIQLERTTHRGAPKNRSPRSKHTSASSSNARHTSSVAGWAAAGKLSVSVCVSAQNPISITS